MNLKTVALPDSSEQHLKILELPKNQMIQEFIKLAPEEQSYLLKYLIDRADQSKYLQIFDRLLWSTADVPGNQIHRTKINYWTECLYYSFVYALEVSQEQSTPQKAKNIFGSIFGVIKKHFKFLPLKQRQFLTQKIDDLKLLENESFVNRFMFEEIPENKLKKILELAEQTSDHSKLSSFFDELGLLVPTQNLQVIKAGLKNKWLEASQYFFRQIKKLPEELFDQELTEAIMEFLKINEQEIYAKSYVSEKSPIPGELNELIKLIHDLPRALIQGPILEYSRYILRQMLEDPSRARAQNSVVWGIVHYPEPYLEEFGEKISQALIKSVKSDNDFYYLFRYKKPDKKFSSLIFDKQIHNEDLINIFTHFPLEILKPLYEFTFKTSSPKLIRYLDKIHEPLSEDKKSFFNDQLTGWSKELFQSIYLSDQMPTEEDKDHLLNLMILLGEIVGLEEALKIYSIDSATKNLFRTLEENYITSAEEFDEVQNKLKSLEEKISQDFSDEQIIRALDFYNEHQENNYSRPRELEKTNFYQNTLKRYLDQPELSPTMVLYLLSRYLIDHTGEPLYQKINYLLKKPIDLWIGSSQLLVKMIYDNINQIEPRLAVKFFMKAPLFENILNDSQKKEIDSKIPSDREKVNIFYRCYWANRDWFQKLSETQKNTFHDLFLYRSDQIKSGISSELNLIIKDHVAKRISVFDQFEILKEYFENGFKSYQFFLFKFFILNKDHQLDWTVFNTKIESIKNKILLASPYIEVIKETGDEPELIAALAMQVIPPQSGFFDIDRSNRMIQKSFGEDEILRTSLKTNMPEVINPQDSMSYPLKKLLTKYAVTKISEYKDGLTREFLNLSGSVTFAKVLKAPNLEELKNRLRLFVRKQDGSLFGNWVKEFENDCYKITLKIIDHFNDRAQEIIKKEIEIIRQSQSGSVLKEFENSIAHFENNITQFIFEDILIELHKIKESFVFKQTDSEEIIFQMGKNAFLAICGGLADVCIADDYELFKRQDFNVLSMRNNHQYLGFTMLYFIKNKDKKMLIIGGIEPAAYLTEQFDLKTLYHQTIDTLIEYAQKSDIHEIALLGVDDISNRHNLNKFIRDEIMPNSEKDMLEKGIQRTSKSVLFNKIHYLWKRSEQQISQ